MLVKARQVSLGYSLFFSYQRRFWALVMLPQLASLGLGFVFLNIVFQFGGFCSVVEVDGVVSDAEVGDGLDSLVPCVCLGDAGSAAGPGQLSPWAFGLLGFVLRVRASQGARMLGAARSSGGVVRW